MKTLFSFLFILSLSTLVHAQEAGVNAADCTVEGQKYLSIVVEQLETKNKGVCSQKITYNSPRKLTAQIACKSEKGISLAAGIIRLRCGEAGVSVFESKFSSK